MLVNSLMSLRVLFNAANFLTSRGIIFSGRTLLHGVMILRTTQFFLKLMWIVSEYRFKCLEIYYYYYYYYYYSLSLLCRLFTITFLQPCLQDTLYCSYSSVTVHSTCNSISRVEGFVLLHYWAYFLKYVCSVQYG